MGTKVDFPAKSQGKGQVIVFIVLFEHLPNGFLIAGYCLRENLDRRRYVCYFGIPIIAELRVTRNLANEKP